MPDFKWSDLKDKDILGGRAGGMPEMVFEYILKQNGLDPQKDMNIDQSIDFGSTAAAFPEDRVTSPWNLNQAPLPWKKKEPVMW